MPNDIILENLTPQVVAAANPLIATRVDMRDGSRGGTAVAPGELLFSTDFSDTPDWNSGLLINDLDGDGMPDRIQKVDDGYTLPEGWYACYQAPDWSPSMGYPDRLETINVMDSPLAMPGYTRCLVMTRDSESNIWNSDSTLMNLIEPQNEVYVEFWMRFDDDWTWQQNSSSKLFRISCWNGQDSISRYFSDGNHGPIFIWNWNRTSYGVRMLLTFRGGPYGDNYGLGPDRIENSGGMGVGGIEGAFNLPWTTGRVGQGPNGTTAQLPDLVNGGFLPTTSDQIITHPQLFGSGYFKMGFYVKMQSAVNVADGAAAMFFNDKRVFCRKQINWCPTGIDGTSVLPKWNLVDFGGNDNFSAYPDSERRQELYAFQKINIYRQRQPWVEWDTE